MRATQAAQDPLSPRAERAWPRGEGSGGAEEPRRWTFWQCPPSLSLPHEGEGDRRARERERPCSAAPPTTCSGCRATSSAPRTSRACWRSATASRCCRARATARTRNGAPPCAAPAARRAISPSTAPTMTRDVVNFMLFDADNPSSVYSCLATARRNARAQRTALTREMWESLNGAWLEFSAIDADALAPNALPPLLDWIKERSALFRGALLNTILRNDTFYFSQLGTFLERADNTARILDVKYYVLLPHNEMVGGEIDSVQWAAILRSVSAHRSYRWVYKDSYKPWRIADYLILNRQMPRSLRSCYEEILLALVELGHFYGAVNGPQSLADETLRQSGRRRHEHHLPVGPARVPGRLHRPQQPPGHRDLRHLPLHRRGGRHADQRPPRHPLHLRRAGELHRAEPAADAGAVQGPARRRLARARARAAPSRCSSRTASAIPCTSSRVSTPAQRAGDRGRRHRRDRGLQRRGRRPRQVHPAARVPEGDARRRGPTPPSATWRNRSAARTRSRGCTRWPARCATASSTLPGITDAHTSAAEALADGKGVCQDHAHIFISAARTLGIPARYVTGYLVMDDRRSPQRRTTPGRKPGSTRSAGSASTSPTASAPPSATCASPAASTPAMPPRSSARAGAARARSSRCRVAVAAAERAAMTSDRECRAWR